MVSASMGSVSASASVRRIASADWGIFFVRFILGVIFVAHGLQQTFGLFGGHSIGESAAMMGGIGIPAPLAYLSILTQLIGGFFLLVGFLSRIAAIGILIDMAVAAIVVHLPNGFFLGAKPGVEYVLALIAMSAAIIIAGPGALAMTDLEGRIFQRSSTS